MIASEDVFDDLPPLEDMSEELTKRQTLLKKIQSTNKPQPTKQTTKISTSADLLDIPDDAVPNSALLVSQPVVKKVESQPASTNGSAKPKTSSTASAGFGGMKKGFLFSSGGTKKKATPATKPTPTTTKPKPTPIETLKPTTSTTTPSLQLDEVQEAMKSQMSLLDKQEWLTPDFMTKLESNPHLSRTFQDPEFAKAIVDFQTDPAKALVKWQHKPAFLNALKEFMGMMGEQLQTMEEKESAKKQEDANKNMITPIGPSIPSDLPEHEKEIVKNVLKDKELQEILRDPDMQKFLVEIQKRGSRGIEAYIATQNPIMRHKIQKLVDCGLLQIRM